MKVFAAYIVHLYVLRWCTVGHEAVQNLT